MLPRSGRRFGVNFDFGAVFGGPPTTTLNLTGAVCTTSPTTGCVNAATDPAVQFSMRKEEKDINDQIHKFKYYPVVRIGVSWRIK
jgi:hypothetical protein